MEHDAGQQPAVTAVIRPLANIGGSGSTDLVYVDAARNERHVSNCRHSADPLRPSRVEDTRALIRTARDDGITDMIVDLGRVSWVNSTGVGELVTLRNEIESAGGRVVFANASGRVANILAVTQVAGLFLIFGSLAEAIDHYSKSGGRGGA